MMCAFSLRTWRRNGVACDELLFLPGTLIGHEHGVEGPLIEMPEQPTSPENGSSPSSPVVDDTQKSLDSDAPSGRLQVASSPSFRQRRGYSEDDLGLPTDPITKLSTSQSEDENDTNSADDDQRSWDMDGDDDDEKKQSQSLIQQTSNHENSASDVTLGESSSFNGTLYDKIQGLVVHLWTFFFNRASATTASGAAYAPSGPSVFGAALDLSMPVLFNFHVFIEAWNYMQGPDGSDTPVKILPLIFLSILIVRTVIPPGRRFFFWGALKFTFTAPLHHVRFRDEFIGELLTSWVRPSQDLFFALSYYLIVIWGTLSGKYDLEESGFILEKSWLLHNVLMPSFAILPLWLKYLQTLRQAYDANTRWPHQANSFKYLTATVVVIYGITHPKKRTSPWWIASFAFCLVYQILWDIFVDWELFEIQQQIQLVEAENDSWFARVSSLRPSSRILLNLQMYVVQPLLDQYQRLRVAIPSWRQIQLRQTLLYKTEFFYWKIVAYNTIMRFTWMWCFIPAYHFERGRAVLSNNSDVDSYWGVLLPIAEIVRRTLWGFLFLERETIKMMDIDTKYSRVENSESHEVDDDIGDDADSKLGDRSFRSQLLPTWLDNQQQVAHNAATSKAKQRDQLMRRLFVVELSLWAAAFVAFGCMAAIY